MHITELVYLYGEEAPEKICEEIDSKMAEFSDWLALQNDLSDMLRDFHLSNCYVMLTFMSEDSPCIFPEEVCDNDDTPDNISNDTSTCFGLKQFIYNTYIRKGPKPGDMTQHILQSIDLYYKFLLDKNIIHFIPNVVKEVTTDQSCYEERLVTFHQFDQEFAEDETAWAEAFERWDSSF